ncbi:hypothetical protein H0H87_012061 [Tephrocybe sp. NHM501043]|nr:hypothetical protein H0H87_012061 [Tephrocybe sp. NHM501043]
MLPSLSYYLIFFLPLFSLVSAAPFCGLVPPKQATRAVPVAANLSDDVVAAAWYAGWRSGKLAPSNITWSKYNVMTFAFAVTTPDINSLPIASNESFPDFVTQAKSNNVKALLSIGGWTGSRFFSNHVATEQNRTAFVNTCYNLLKNNNLDGLDFDWEYPNNDGMCNAKSPDDSANFFAFLKELRAKMGPDYMLTLAVATTPFADSNGQPMADVSEVANYVDHIAIMAYDINGPSNANGLVGPNAPLTGSESESCAGVQGASVSATSAVQAWTTAKFPADKIVLAVGAYAHTYSVTSQNALDGNNEIASYPHFSTPTPFGEGETAAMFANSTDDDCGNPSGPSGLFYFSGLIDAKFLDGNGSPMTGIWYRKDNCSQTPFLYNNTSQIMASYDDADSFAAKGRFINDKALKGFAMWDATGDYNDILLDSISNAIGIEPVCG